MTKSVQFHFFLSYKFVIKEILFFHLIPMFSRLFLKTFFSLSRIYKRVNEKKVEYFAFRLCTKQGSKVQ